MRLLTAAALTAAIIMSTVALVIVLTRHTSQPCRSTNIFDCRR